MTEERKMDDAVLAVRTLTQTEIDQRVFDGRTLQAGLDQVKLRTDMLNGARFLKTNPLSTGRLGVTGFCWGGSTTHFLAVALGSDLQAGVPFYGAAAETARVPDIKAPLLIQYAEASRSDEQALEVDARLTRSRSRGALSMRQRHSLSQVLHAAIAAEPDLVALSAV
jgi:dienelactone hydrolase